MEKFDTSFYLGLTALKKGQVEKAKAIIDQKAELLNIFERERIIKREILEDYRKYLSSDQIKVITGPQESGEIRFLLRAPQRLGLRLYQF